MQMTVRRLNTPVVVDGDPLFGIGRARVTMAPRSSWSTLGWDLKTRDRNIPISIRYVSASMQNISIRNGDSSVAHVIEHLLPLKFAGFLEMTITSTHSLPYTGSARKFFDAVLSSGYNQFQEEVPVKTPGKSSTYRYSKLRGGVNGYTCIGQRNDGKLSITVRVSYPGLGEHEEYYEFPNDELLLRVASVGSQGWPHSRFWISKACGKLGLWKHHDKVVWPQSQSPEETLKLFADHRCLDILGALGLLMHGNWLSAHVDSVCSGHEADLKAFSTASSNLVSLRI